MSGQLEADASLPMVKREGSWTRIWRPFWAVPVAICLAGVLAGILLPEADDALSGSFWFLFPGGPSGARSLLGTIASSMISVTGLVFSITIVVLQLASSQFTPRILSSFLDSRVTQVTLGIFIATFVYALTVLRSVRGDYAGGNAFVPQLSVTVAFLLVLASVGCFLAFIHHITSSIQVSQVVSRTADSTLDVVDDMFPADGRTTVVVGDPAWPPAGGPSATVSVGRDNGFVAHVDHVRLLEVSEATNAVLAVDVSVGEYVVEGQVLVRLWDATPSDDDRRVIAGCIELTPERSVRQDVAFGIRRLVDIAARALSPGINDPTTAAQVIDALHRILRSLVQRRTPSRYVADEGGRLRLVHRPQGVAFLLDLAVVEISHWGAPTVQIPRRLVGMLDDLAGVARPEYLPDLERLRRRVADDVEDDSG